MFCFFPLVNSNGAFCSCFCSDVFSSCVLIAVLSTELLSIKLCVQHCRHFFFPSFILLLMNFCIWLSVLFACSSSVGCLCHPNYSISVGNVEQITNIERITLLKTQNLAGSLRGTKSSFFLEHDFTIQSCRVI